MGLFSIFKSVDRSKVETVELSENLHLIIGEPAIGEDIFGIENEAGDYFFTAYELQLAFDELKKRGIIH